jgi:hypothetical protein
MSDEKSQADTQQANTDGQAQTAWAMPFQEMMEKMMARCGCRPEQMGATWAECCGMSPEKKSDSHPV